jgi:hypothetical protein
MALVKADLKTVMINSVLNKTSATEAIAALGTAIANYVKDNAEIAFVWDGINPGPPLVVDPIISAVGEIVLLTIPLTPANSIGLLGNQIKIAFITGTYNITQAGFSCTPLPMSDIPVLSWTLSGEDTQDAAFDSLAQQLITWITGYAPAGKILGAHGTFLAPNGTGGEVSSIL